MMKPRNLGISVVIVNWSSRDDLVACLDSLRAQTDRDFETIVVDNGSTDDSVRCVRDDYPDVRLVATGTNLGFAEGCNRGIAVATQPWIATLNNDAIADPRWIAEQRHAAAVARPQVGMIQSRVVFKQRPGYTNSTGVLLFPNGTVCDRDFEAPVREGEQEQEIFCASAAAALYRRTMLDEVRMPTGIFDRTYFMYLEDVDLGWRARLAGWEAVYVPTAIVHHGFHGSSSRRGNHFVAVHCQRNRARTMLKNGSWPFVVAGIPRTLRDIVWQVSRVGPGAIGEYAAAVRDGLRQRAAVSRVARERRDAVERRWVAPAPR